MTDTEVLMVGSRKLFGGLALVAVVATGALVAPASGERGIAEDVTIKFKFKRGIPVFKGPDEVLAGGSITVVNRSDPNATGPQSFSLVKKSKLPSNERQREKCGDAPYGLICGDIAEAHDVAARNAAIEDVDNGVDGTWDAVFDGENPGDSYFFEVEDESHTRDVGGPGRFHFMSIIYPKAQGSIRVVAP